MSSALERRTIYCTPHWKRVRARVLERAGYRCQTCREGGRTVAASMVHHVRSIRAGGDVFDQANLVALCRGCHIGVHTVEPKPEVDPRWTALVQELL